MRSNLLFRMISAPCGCEIAHLSAIKIHGDLRYVLIIRVKTLVNSLEMKSF